MKSEISAGGIVICQIHQTWYVLILKDMNSTWTFPKGLIEKGETPEEAATREIAEEVGITGLRLLSPLSPIQYIYQRNGKINKTVYYFVFVSKKRAHLTVQKEEGIHEAKWLPIDDAVSEIGYRQTNVALLAETKRFIAYTHGS